MKTNKLMTAFALSAMFAACTQDAELNETLAKNDFSNIPMVEAEFTASKGVDSRMANQFGWEVGDLIGFAWMGPESTYEGKAYGNYPMKCTDASGAFKGESMYYVGDYFAYIPYSETTTSLSFIPFSIANQKMSSNSEDYAPGMIYISPKVVSLSNAENAENKAGRGQNVALELSQLSSLSTIKLSFKNASNLTDLKVEKLELAMVNPSDGDHSILPVNFQYKPQKDGTVKKWNEDITPNNFYSYYTTGIAAVTNTGVITLENEDGLAVAADGTLTTYAVIMAPASFAGNAYLSLTATTNYGVIKGESIKITDAKHENAVALSATTPLFTKLASKGTISAEFDAEKIEVGNKEVATQAELEEYLDVLVATKVTENVTITAKPATANDDKTFVLTDFTFPANLKAGITLTTDDTKAESFVFAGNTVINYPMTALKDAEIEGTMTMNYIESKNTWSGNKITVDNGAVLINNGIIYADVATKAANEEEGLTFGKYINNANTAYCAGTLYNKGEAQWIAGSLPAANNDNLVYAEATDLAGIEAANEAFVPVIRLLDGAWIGNNTEAIEYEHVQIIECYGNVDFYVTDTPRGAAIKFGFPWATIYAMKDATLTINSDNKNNILETGDAIGVKKNAVLTISNIICDARVTNEGSVILNNAKDVKQGDQFEGSSWVNSENK